MICMSTDTGVGTGVVKIRTVCSVKQKRSAKCLQIPAKQFLQKVCCFGAISRSLVHSCCCESSIKHFIFFMQE